MAQQTVVRSIPKYPFKMPDTEIVAWSSSGQGMTISETTWSANIITGGSSVNVTTTRNYAIPDFTKTFTRTSIFDENAVYLVALNHIDTDGARLRFAEPITASIAYQDNEYFCRNEELGIITMSTTLDECIKDFKEEILFVWNEYGKASDDILTDGAKELKRRIQQYVAK